VLRVRYKKPDEVREHPDGRPAAGPSTRVSDASSDFRFAASVAAFGMILKNSQYRGDVTLRGSLDTAAAAAVRTAVDIAPSSSRWCSGQWRWGPSDFASEDQSGGQFELLECPT
jgi:hypothetical protein